MQALEEKALSQCKAILRKMKIAMQKQRNISMDVKDGTSEMSELFDVIENYRSSWKAAELERSKESRKAKENTSGNLLSETPVSTLKKRTATRPAAQEPSKKVRNTQTNDGFQTVTYKKGKKESNTKEADVRHSGAEKTKNKPSARTRTRPEAVLVRPAEGKSYAEVLCNLRKNLKPEDSDSNIQSVRKTKSGDMLLELSKRSKTDKLCDVIKDTLKECATAKTIKQLVKLEIRDIDSITQEDEIISAIREGIGDTSQEILIQLTGVNRSEQRRAFVTLPMRDASKILAEQRIKIGWTRCRVKRCLDIKRCFKCFGVGHVQNNCNGPDRRDLCIRCGESGHKMKTCTKAPRCCICASENRSDVGHLPGTANCSSVAKKESHEDSSS
ncbi:uncharacterized protein LOC120322245 isoform X3 [Drosophila yakuba]|uniref:uncharacterized protein LOC120322245 isoform X3 n=1 Tax=Drosophila yakuba TaxID=7245 RepID=UPI00193086F0|nr:uncharacterized protein LOC120322245 isoform X3 [Drosophila yakuba]